MVESANAAPGPAETGEDVAPAPGSVLLRGSLEPDAAAPADAPVGELDVDALVVVPATVLGGLVAAGAAMVVVTVGAVTLVLLVGTETVALTVGVDTVVLTA